MNLLNENFFIENKNGRVIESQLADLKAKANIWSELAFLIGAFVFVIYFRLYEGEAPGLVIWAISLIFILFWLAMRLPAIVKYYFWVLPDVRANRVVYATGKLVYEKGYVLQADDVRLSLSGDKNEGLLIGNLYEVYYLPRAKMAISARLMQRASDAYQAREFTQLFAQALGFTEADIRANRDGEFTFEQKMTIVKKSWWVFLILLVFFGFVLWIWIPMLIAPAFMDDAILFSICMGGLVIFVLAGMVVGFRDARNILALFEGKVEQAEGSLHLSARTTRSGRSGITRYYLDLDRKSEFQISRRIYEVLIQGLYCRAYYAPRMKYLASLEVIQVEQT